jgi:hypothetical protein
MRARDVRYQEAVRKWLGENGADIAASFLLPRELMSALKRTSVGADDIALSLQLTYLFNQVDRQVFKSAHRNRGVRVPRIVTLERTDEVGWHAHVLVKTPEHFAPERLSLLMQRLWLRQLRWYTSPRFVGRLYWAEHISGSYFEYSTKQVGGKGDADWMNIVRT